MLTRRRALSHTPIERSVVRGPRTVALAVLVLAAFPARALAQFLCEDTQYHKGRKGDLSTSRYHVLQAYGDVAYRSTNFFAEQYDGIVSASSLRVFFPRLSELVRTRVPLPDPFVGITISTLTDIDWENRADAVAGAEWRPLRRGSLPAGPARWLSHIRLYVSRYQTRYLRDQEAFATRPRSDIRLGAELYRECNIYPTSHAGESFLWAEVWADASWRRTNFVVNDFRSWTMAVVPRIGVRFPRGKEAALMLYAVGEFLETQRSEAWQNRVLAGGGIRVMPFRWHDGAWADLLRGGRIYVETLWLAKEFEKPIGTPTPERDLRVGASFVVNRWQ